MLTDRKFPSASLQIWGGVECTINRIKDNFRDQLSYAGHYSRPDDIEAFANLNIRALRYPVLWEFHEKQKGVEIDWSWSDQQLQLIRKNNIVPIVGLVHHGSGPSFTSLLDEAFPNHLADYAASVARRYPWVEHFTPVNEPLTTARFSGLYGHWYPHLKDDYSFVRMLINQIKGIILSMQAIRKINPSAKLIQTEDLAKIHSSRFLKYQADFENERRWLTYDLLFGRVNNQHYLWKYLKDCGIAESEIHFINDNKCAPDLLGVNYYVTSERYLDNAIERYPPSAIGGNRRHRYADVEAVRITGCVGLNSLLKELWERYQLPIAITEAHLTCTREEQIRWLKEIWDTCCQLKEDKVDIRAVTAWSLLGAFDWNSLLTGEHHHYESGVFDVRNNSLRPTALTKVIKGLATEGNYSHPLLHQKGWWHNETQNPSANDIAIQSNANQKPILIIGKHGTLANVLARLCTRRNIPFKNLSRTEINLLDPEDVEYAINKFQPWAVINAAGYVKVDEAETNSEECFAINAQAPAFLARSCRQHGIPFMTFSSDLVFDGIKQLPYVEADSVKPLNVYGQSKAAAEKLVMENYPSSLIIRTSAFFGPWDQYNFAYYVLNTLRGEKTFDAVNDVIISPTYVPDMVDASLDLFIDEAEGIWHLCNDCSLTWFDFANELADRGGYQKRHVIAKTISEMNLHAPRPKYSAMMSEKGMKLPTLDHALNRYFKEKVY